VAGVIRQILPPPVLLTTEDMLGPKRHRWIEDALMAIGVAVLAVALYKLLDLMGLGLIGGP
jgi:hypothetical protein